MTFTASFSQPPLFERWPVNQKPMWHMYDSETGMVILVGRNGRGEFIFNGMMPGHKDIKTPERHEAERQRFIEYEGYPPGRWFDDGADTTPETRARFDEMVQWWHANHETFQVIITPATSM